MPASSRKRNKGKDRKAKKEESKRIEMYNDWQSWARGKSKKIYGVTLGLELEIPQCNHGLIAILPEESHPVSRFITDFFYSDNADFITIFRRHPEVQNDVNYQKMAAEIFIRIETNGLIEDNATGVNVAKAIIILENYGKTGEYVSTVTSRSVALKIRNQSGTINSRRDLLKFYRKRITCSCLKKMHIEARKTLPKIGICDHCEEVKERTLLMVCSRCMICQYCSRKCQVAASPKHRVLCDMFAETHKKTISNDA